MNARIHQLRDVCSRMCNEQTGHAISFVRRSHLEFDPSLEKTHPYTFFVHEGKGEVDDDFSLFESSKVYSIEWPYMEVKFVLSFGEKPHLLIIGQHEVALSLLSSLPWEKVDDEYHSSFFIDGITEVDIIDLDRPIVMQTSVTHPLCNGKDGRGDKTFFIEGRYYANGYDATSCDYRVSFSRGDPKIDKSNSTLDEHATAIFDTHGKHFTIAY